MKHIFLLKELALTEFKLRYNSSILGYLWSLLNPLLQFGVLYIVFSIIVKFDLPHYPLYLLLGIIIWNFLIDSTTTAMNSILSKAMLIKQIKMPNYILVIASNITTAIGFILNFAVFFIFFIFSKAQFSFFILLIPFYIFLLLIFISGLSFILSALYIRFRDIQHLWSIFLQMAFWLTPIVYPSNLIPEKYRLFLVLNPFYAIIESMRDIIIYANNPDIILTAALLIWVTVTFVTGCFIFTKMSKKFAEYL